MAALCLGLLTLPAAQARDRGEAKAVPVGEAEARHREFVAYGEWVVEVDSIFKPVFAALSELTPQWEAATRGPNVADTPTLFAPVLNKSKNTIADARLKLDAMPVPTFARLNLDPLSSPAGIKAQMVRTLDHVDSLLDSFGPVLEALGKEDPRAAEAAVAQALASAATMFDAQEALAGAWAATLEEDDPTRDLAEIERLFFRSGGRLMTSGERMMRRGADPTLAADLLGIADAIDGVVARGGARLDAAQAETMAKIAETGSDAEGRSEKAMLTKEHAIDTLSRESLATAQVFATALRTTATRAASTPITLGELQPLVQALQDTRLKLNTLGNQQAEIAAGMR